MSKTRIHLSLLAVAAIALLPASALSADTIAYWPFGTNGFHDVSGNGHDLTSTTVTESDAGYVTLNGTSQFLTTASALDLSGETAVTFECWTRVTGKNSGFGNLFSSSNPGADQVGGFVVYYTGLLQAQFRIDSNNWQIDNSSGSVLGKIDGASGDGMWHHVAYVIDRTKTNHTATRLYVDGVEVGVAAGTNSGSLPLFSTVCSTSAAVPGMPRATTS